MVKRSLQRANNAARRIDARQILRGSKNGTPLLH
jgi:hypothetical protein